LLPLGKGSTIESTSRVEAISDMRNIITSLNLVRYIVLTATVCSLLFLFGVFNHAGASTKDEARDGRLITIHDRGEERVILTHAQNVEDALKDAGITTVNDDRVEPALDSELIETNYTVNIYRARPVIVVDGVFRQKIMTAAQTKSAIVTAAGLELNDEDVAVLSQSDDIVDDGASVILTLDRATQFTLNLYGKTATAYTQGATVGEMLDRKHVSLGPDDNVSVDLDTPITAGMTVSVYRDGVSTVTVEEEIAFAIRQTKDASQPASYRKIHTAGTVGKKLVTYEITIEGGKEIKRVAIQTVVLEQPKEQTETVGAKPSFEGGFAEAMAKLRQCESGGNYANKRNSLYRGAYQFGYQTWANNGGYYDPADAPPALQDAAAKALYERRGWQPWPACSKKLGLPDIFR
jgi:uncharacterized protein YabE (DUF348 family)